MQFKPALLRFKFDNFEYLPSEVGSVIESEVQTDCNGHKWRIELSVDRKRDDEEGRWICLFLCNENKKTLEARYAWKMKNARGKSVVEEKQYSGRIQAKCRICLSGPQFMKQSDVTKDGSLCVDLTMQVKYKIDEMYDPQPTKAHQRKMLELLCYGEKADITTYVGGESTR